MNYKDQSGKVCTPDGVKQLMEISKKAKKLLSTSGAFKSSFVFSGEDWLCLNCLDALVSGGILKEVTGDDVAGQDRVFVSGEIS